MSLGQIVVLTAIVGAFVVFAAVLGWGDYRAQQLARRIRNRDREDAAAAATAMASKPTGQGAAAVSATAQARWPQSSSDRLHRVA